MKGVAVLAPGYGGTGEQPLLRRLAGRLEQAGLHTARITFSTKRATRDHVTEMNDLRAAREGLVAAYGGPVVLIGRSFGGRMAAFLAALEPPAALVILGHPISPPGRPRPADEEVLAALGCPTLVVQGDRDELGPLAVLERLAGRNPRVDLVSLPGTGHAFGPREGEAIDHAVRWLEATLTA